MSSAISKALRWLLVPVSGAGVVVSCVFAARWAVAYVDLRCPASSMVGGSCVEPWHTTAVEIAIYLAVALGAFAFVLLPALIAPGFRRAVAIVAFLAALVVAGAGYFWMGWADMLMPFLIAVLCGAIGLWWTWSRRYSNEA